jgi:NAD(P)-dependent dehydrogenase (short-subunit alcohol dehydrogenase family)
MNVVITGVSRGIGMELARLALDKGHKVLGVARKSVQLAGDFTFIEADLMDERAIDRVVKALNGWDRVDVLINNAGVARQGDSREGFLACFELNSIVPFLLTKALLPLLKNSKSPKVVNVSSLMGSITDNNSGGTYAYRASKAALNIINKSMACDNDWLTTVVVHPGWVKTDMGGPEAPIEVAESGAGLWNVIDSLNRTDSGHFYDFRGKELPW